MTDRVRDLGWRAIGDVAVDSGLLALVDPLNGVDPDDFLGREELVQTARSAEGFPVGLVVRPGVGDGRYQVEARLEDLEGLGRRVAEIRIGFL